MPTKRKSKVKRTAPKPHAPKPVVAKTKQQQLIEMLRPRVPLAQDRRSRCRRSSTSGSHGEAAA